MANAGVAQGKLGLGRALWALAVAGLVLGLSVVLALATSEHAELRGWEAAVALVIGWGFIGAGLYAWWRRPANNFGPLMTATGFLFFVSELAASDNSHVFTVASLLGNLFLAVVVHMLLAMPTGRLPEPVELAAYFVTSEALTNVAKYAHASSARVRVWRDARSAYVEVSDDGVGGADEHAGTGLRGLADRVAALDGSLRVASPPGAGTVVVAELPCGS